MNIHPRTTTMAALALLALFAAPGATASVGAAQEGPSPPAEAQPEARTVRIKILGMSCPFCAYGAQQKLKRLDGVEEVEVALQSGIATVTLDEGADVSNEILKKTVDDAGFEAAAIVRSFDSEYPDWNPEEIPDGAGAG